MAQDLTSVSRLAIAAGGGRGGPKPGPANLSVRGGCPTKVCTTRSITKPTRSEHLPLSLNRWQPLTNGILRKLVESGKVLEDSY